MAQIPRGDEGMICPLHKEDMSTVCHKCPLWTQVRGKHPQTDQEVDRWACSLAWMPLLLIENSQMQRQTGAAVESLRNEVVNRQAATDLMHAALPHLSRSAIGSEV
jgi:hypothetical protein